MNDYISRNLRLSERIVMGDGISLFGRRLTRKPAELLPTNTATYTNIGEAFGAGEGGFDWNQDDTTQSNYFKR